MLPLLKILFQTLFANYRNGRLLKKKRILLTLVALAILPTMIILQTNEMFAAWLLMPNLGIDFLLQFVSTSLFGVSALMVLTGLPGVMHHFFLAPDLELLQTWPLRERDIFLQKMIHSSVNNAGLFIALGLPILMSMGMALQASPLFYLLIPICCILFIFLPTALAALVAFSMASLFSIKKMRRFTTLVLGLFILLAWAGFQFLRLSRLNPMTSEFDAGAVEGFSTTMAHLQSAVLPSDWLVTLLHSAHVGEWGAVLFNFTLLIGSALFLPRLVILWRIRLQHRNIRIQASPRKQKSRALSSIGRGSILIAMLKKDIRLTVRDTRFFQSSFLLMAMLLLAPLFTSVETIHAGETLAFLTPYIPVTILSLIVSSTLARQSLPIERLSFVWLLASPLNMKKLLLAKWLRIAVMIAPMTMVAVLTTALKSGTMDSLFFMLIVHVGLVMCGASVGMASAAFSTQFDWSDPRYMAHPASVYLSSLIVLITGALGIGIAVIGMLLHQQMIAFLIIFLYVSLVFGVALRAAESRLAALNWMY